MEHVTTTASVVDSSWRPSTPEVRIHPPSWFLEYGLPVQLTGTDRDNDVIDLYQAFIAERKLAVTDNGYVGLVPLGTQCDDLVCIFLGSGVPFVLRPTNGAYTLLGASYVYGLMKGEALEGKDLSLATEQDPHSPFCDFIII
jgi:hypothetical protein